MCRPYSRKACRLVAADHVSNLLTKLLTAPEFRDGRGNSHANNSRSQGVGSWSKRERLDWQLSGGDLLNRRSLVRRGRGRQGPGFTHSAFCLPKPLGGGLRFSTGRGPIAACACRPSSDEGGAGITAVVGHQRHRWLAALTLHADDLHFLLVEALDLAPVLRRATAIAAARASRPCPVELQMEPRRRPRTFQSAF